MKCLTIENGKAFYSIDEEHKYPLDHITKDDLLKILDLIIEKDADIDEFNDSLVQNAAHKIIYRNLYSKLKDLSANRKRFIDESTSLYQEAIDRYRVLLADDDTTS